MVRRSGSEDTRWVGAGRERLVGAVHRHPHGPQARLVGATHVLAVGVADMDRPVGRGRERLQGDREGLPGGFPRDAGVWPASPIPRPSCSWQENGEPNGTTVPIDARCRRQIETREEAGDWELAEAWVSGAGRPP